MERKDQFHKVTSSENFMGFPPLVGETPASALQPRPFVNGHVALSLATSRLTWRWPAGACSLGPGHLLPAPPPSISQCPASPASSRSFSQTRSAGKDPSPQLIVHPANSAG